MKSHFLYNFYVYVMESVMNIGYENLDKELKSTKIPQQSVSCFLLLRLSCKWVINKKKDFAGKTIDMLHKTLRNVSSFIKQTKGGKSISTICASLERLLRNYLFARKCLQTLNIYE